MIWHIQQIKTKIRIFAFLFFSARSRVLHLCSYDDCSISLDKSTRRIITCRVIWRGAGSLVNLLSQLVKLTSLSSGTCYRKVGLVKFHLHSNARVGPWREVDTGTSCTKGMQKVRKGMQKVRKGMQKCRKGMQNFRKGMRKFRKGMRKCRKCREGMQKCRKGMQKFTAQYFMLHNIRCVM